MAKMNLLVSLNGYQDSSPSTNPSQNNFKWVRDTVGINISEPTSQSLSLQAGQSTTLVAGAVSTSADSTTTYNIAKKAGTGSTYIISKSGGTSPAFRTARSTGADATTEITITKNASLMIISSTAGTALDLIVGGVQVGDEVRLGTSFNVSNQGKYKVLARTATSLTVENDSVVAQTLVLGAGFASQLSVFSSSGVQVGDQVEISGNFSSVTHGTYEITDVSPESIEIYSLEALPSESDVSNNPSAILVYRSAKNFLYVESDRKIEITIDGSSKTLKVEPVSVGSSISSGVFMTTGPLKEVVITNTSTESANIFYVSAE